MKKFLALLLTLMLLTAANTGLFAALAAGTDATSSATVQSGSSTDATSGATTKGGHGGPGDSSGTRPGKPDGQTPQGTPPAMPDGQTPPDGAAPDGMPGGQDAGSETLNGATVISGETQNLVDPTFASTAADENALLVTSGGSAVIEGGTFTKSGDTTSEDASNFYGRNAVLAVQSGSTATLKNVTLTSGAEGANAVFATGEGASITLSGVTIRTTGNSSRGLDATMGGTITADNVDIATTGAHCAPIATDRGEGTVTVTGGTLSSQGDGSPCIYSTGSITLSGVTGTATGSECAVVEGKNSITLSGSSLTGAGNNGVMLYQSTSGDASDGTAVFSCQDSTLTTTSQGAMFYITNTKAEADLTRTALNFTSGVLVNVAGNDGSRNWGQTGANGGQFTLSMNEETVSGDMLCDAISTLAVTLNATSWTGALDTANAAQSSSLTLSADSTWTLTADSHVDVLTDADTTFANIQSAGFTVYYDAANELNAALNGQTYTLPGGGTLAPEA